MVTVTLVGETQAKEGLMFVFVGPLTECRDCRLKAVCFNLEEGRTYVIKAVRAVHHDCKVHEGGVRVVEVEKSPIRTTVPSRAALEGTTYTWQGKECQNLGCAHYLRCTPRGMKAGERYRIVKVAGYVECPDGESLKEVVLDI
ncbi:MAG: UPF0179 family protein [Euryarchaeota archaeon]|nr:UPF0179 family protein [Euryarchaeota archaeon]